MYIHTESISLPLWPGSLCSCCIFSLIPRLREGEGEGEGGGEQRRRESGGKGERETREGEGEKSRGERAEEKERGGKGERREGKEIEAKNYEIQPVYICLGVVVAV